MVSSLRMSIKRRQPCSICAADSRVGKKVKVPQRPRGAMTWEEPRPGCSHPRGMVFQAWPGSEAHLVSYRAVTALRSVAKPATTTPNHKLIHKAVHAVVEVLLIPPFSSDTINAPLLSCPKIIYLESLYLKMQVIIHNLYWMQLPFMVIFLQNILSKVDNYVLQ